MVADMSHLSGFSPASLNAIGYQYNEATDKWNIADAAADYIFLGNNTLDFEIPGTLKGILHYEKWKEMGLKPGLHSPNFSISGIKAWSDGSNQGLTGYQRAPYLNSTNRGALN